MDRGAWRATVHGVGKSGTQLKDSPWWAAPLPGLPELTGAPLFSAGPNLKEWLREQFCDHPLEHCEDTRLHDAAYVGDLQTLRNLLQEESYRR